MKTVKELKSGVNERFIGCCGENAAIFFMTSALFAFMILLWMTFTEAVGKSPLPQDISGGMTIIFTQIVLIATVLLLTPFFYGVKWYRIQQVRGNDVPAESIFRCYTSIKRLFRMFRFSIEINKKRVKFVLPMAIFLGIAAQFTVKLKKMGGWVETVSSAIMLVLILIAVFSGIALNCRYAAAGYLFVLDPEKPPKEIIRRSEEISRDRTDYILRCVFSASGLMLLCVLIFPAIFALPYLEMVYTAAVNELIETGPEKDTKNTGEESAESIGKEYSRS